MDIVINGTRYASWDQVPPELRATLGKALPDNDGDGVPDMFSGAAPAHKGRQVFTRTSITVNGRTYGSLDEVPAEIRETLRQAGLGAPAGGQGGAIGPAPVPPPVASTPPPAPAASPPAQPPGPMLLDGVPVDASQDPPGIIRRKHWWQRG